MARLLIDPGHDPKFPGTTNEVQHVRNIMNACRQYFDFIAVPDGLGGTDGNNNLVRKINWVNANSDPNDTLMSFHHNAGGGTGVETFYYGGNTESLNWGNKLVNFLKESSGRPSRGNKADTSTRHGRLGIVRDTDPWAWLIEFGFVDDPTGQDMKVSDDAWARGVAKFVEARGFPVRWPAAPTPTPAPAPAPAPSPPAPDTLYRVMRGGIQLGAFENNPIERINTLVSQNQSLAAVVNDRDKGIAERDLAIAELRKLLQERPDGVTLTPEQADLVSRLKQLLNLLQK